MDSEPRAACDSRARVLHAHLHSRRNDEWAGTRKDDTEGFLDDIKRDYKRAVMRRFGLGKPVRPYKVETDLSARTEWLTTQYFDTTEEEVPDRPWATVSQDMSLRYLGKWELGGRHNDQFNDDMFSQFYMAGSDPVA